MSKVLDKYSEAVVDLATFVPCLQMNDNMLDTTHFLEHRRNKITFIWDAFRNVGSHLRDCC
jgi:hypothetical protein